MGYNPQNPMIVQGDMSILLETMGPLYAEARDVLARFAELEKSPDYVHTYRITPLSLWNAASSGMKPEEIVDALLRYSKYPVPEGVLISVRDQAGRYGLLRLRKENGRLYLEGPDKPTMVQIQRFKQVKPLLKKQINTTTFEVEDNDRGLLKQALIKVGYPVEDLAGYVDGAPLQVELRQTRTSGKPFSLRNYQQDAAEIFYASGGVTGGSGVLVLPCGAGKTVIGIASMSKVKQKTLILTTNITALRQWKSEILDKTTLTDQEVGEYSGEAKEIRPVTITTYFLPSLVVADLNLDGTDDLVIGDGEITGASSQGKVHVFFGPMAGTYSASAADAWFAGETYLYGGSMAFVGDTDGDNSMEVAVGVPDADNSTGALVFLEFDAW